VPWKNATTFDELETARVVSDPAKEFLSVGEKSGLRSDSHRQRDFPCNKKEKCEANLNPS
jgi:hypothetical protein